MYTMKAGNHRIVLPMLIAYIYKCTEIGSIDIYVYLYYLGFHTKI